MYDNTPRPNRNAQIYRERQAGDTYAAIGARHGLSNARVRNIVLAEDVHAKIAAGYFDGWVR